MSTGPAKAELSASRLDASYLWSLFHGAGLAIIACDPEGRVVACNAAAARLFAAAAEAPRHVCELFPESDRAAIAQLVERCATTLEPGERPTRLGGTESEPLEFAVYCTPVLGADGTLDGVALWLRDVTKRKQLQRSLRKSERLAYLGKLAGAVSHHYNGVFSAIAVSVEWAMHMNTMSAMRRALQRALEEVGRGADITRRLLAFAQADHRDEDVADLSETVLYYVDQNEKRLADRGVRLVFDCQRIPMRPVPRAHLLVILENLVQNALDVMPNGGTLSVTLARRDEGSVCLSVTDTGGGIAPADMEHLFEPFYTSKGVLGAGKSNNAGLGLAVVHGFVTDMQGTISASNVPGSGARFDIVLPLKPTE